MSKINFHNIRALALAVIQTESQAVAALANRIDTAFIQACQWMLRCEGRIVVIGWENLGILEVKLRRL
jgi:arabinose-5-phosphate isomerase